MSELDNLRPEVREAYSTLDAEVSPPGRVSYEAYRAWCTICAELLRLAGECAMIPRAQLLANFAAANERAEKAEAEIAIAQNTVDAQQDTMGALKRKLALAEGELAALKARIRGSRHAFLGPNMDRITFLAEDIGPDGEYALVKVGD